MKAGKLLILCKLHILQNIFLNNLLNKEWHSRGQRFDPAYLHQRPRKLSVFFFFLIEAGKNR